MRKMQVAHPWSVHALLKHRHTLHIQYGRFFNYGCFGLISVISQKQSLFPKLFFYEHGVSELNKCHLFTHTFATISVKIFLFALRECKTRFEFFTFVLHLFQRPFQWKKHEKGWIIFTPALGQKGTYIIIGLHKPSNWFIFDPTMG